MKKLLLSVVAVFACFLCVTAETVVLDFNENQYGQTVCSESNDPYFEDGYTFSAGPITVTSNSLNGNGTRFWQSTQISLRVMQKSGITFSCPNGSITELQISGTRVNNLAGVGYSNGTFTGDSESVSLENNGTNTVVINSITVTYTVNDVTIETPTNNGIIDDGTFYIATTRPTGFGIFLSQVSGSLTRKVEADDYCRWIVTSNSDGSYYIKNEASGYYLSGSQLSATPQKLYLFHNTTVGDNGIGISTTDNTDSNLFLNVYTYSNELTTYSNDDGSCWIFAKNLDNPSLPRIADGIKYTPINDEECIVSGYTSVPSEFTVPTSVSLNNRTYTVKTIGPAAFSTCRNLETITIPEGMTFIDYCSFEQCSYLSHVNLPASVNRLGHSAFFRCTLNDVTCLATTPPVLDTNPNNVSCLVFSNLYNTTLRVPQSSISEYESAAIWGDFNVITSIEETPNLKADAGLKFENDTVIAYLDQLFIAPILTKETTADVTYRTDNAAVAEINYETGEVTIYGVGIANIIVDSYENEDFLCGSASYTLIVKESVETQERLDPKIRFGRDTITASLSEGSFTGNTLFKETTATITYSSDNPDVASVDARTGYITLYSVGTAIITARAEENDDFLAGSASYTIIVTEPEYKGPKDAGLSFDKESVTAYLGQPFLPPALTKATTAAVRYSSDNSSVATVWNLGGDVTLVGVGTVTITAQSEANDDFLAGSASYTINVQSISGEEFTYTYEGQTVTYTIIDEEAKTCMTKPGTKTSGPGYEISGDLVLPENPYRGSTKYTLVKIGLHSFRGCSELTSVTLPNTITEIVDGAFHSCSSLTSICIPNYVTSLGRCAFQYCGGLKSVTIGNSLREIGEYNFSNSYYLDKVAYPNTIEWKQIRKEKQFVYDSEQAGAASDGCIYTNDGKSLLFVPANVTSFTIPEGVTTIGKYAFDGKDDWNPCELESLTIPSTIEKVEADAFANCKIKRVNFTDWQKWYGNAKLENLASNPYRKSGAYAGGVQIVAPELKEGVEVIPDYIHPGLIPYKNEIDLPSTLKRIGACAFYNYKEIYTVFMPEGLEEIGESAFEGCELLENPEFPSTLLCIEDNAFKDCKMLTEITLPKSMTSLGAGVFANCSNLERAVLVSDVDILGDDLFVNCESLYKVYLPLQLKRIGDRAFLGCIALDEISLPASLESIGEYAFAGSKNEGPGNIGALTQVNIPNNVKSVGSYAFFRQRLSSLSIGNGVKVIEPYTFSANSLSTIKFPEELTEIKNNAFANNLTISSVQLPSSLTTIEENAFCNSEIYEMVIPDKVTNLPAGSCGGPTILTIGSGVKTMDENAISFGSTLRVIRIKANTPPTLSGALNINKYDNDNLVLIVNKGRRNNYVLNARWKQINNIIEEDASEVVVYMDGWHSISEEIKLTSGYMPSFITKLKVVGPLTETDMRLIKENMTSLLSLDLSEVTNLTTIPENQFESSMLLEIKLPNNLESIADNAFYQCWLLQISELPQGLKSIGSYAFFDCRRVTINRLPESLTSIGDHAFYYCYGLRDIIAGESLESIGSHAFDNCIMLESIDLSQSKISHISDYAFYNCKELDRVILPSSIESIGDCAFVKTGLRDIAFAENVVEIGQAAFRYCPRLVAANLPKNVKAISSKTFADCPRLIAATMPSGTISVAPNVFNGDDKLANISCAAVEAPAAEAGAFDGIRTRYVSLTVPVMSYRSYLNAPQWGKFQNIQNRIPVTIDHGVDVTSIAEEEFQDMIKEDELEAAVEAAAQEPSNDPAQMARRRSAARAVTYDGRHFASLFDGAQIQTGNDGKGTRIFVNPQDGITVTSILFNGEEKLNQLDGNSLLLPVGSNGSLEIKTDAVVSISEVELSDDEITGVYNLSGIKVGNSLEGLPRGIYIVRQGAKSTKVAI